MTPYSSRRLKDWRRGFSGRIWEARATASTIAFQLCVGRWPEPDERDRLIQFYKQQKEILARNPELAAGLFPAQGVEGLNSTEAAAWVSVSRVLLNLDEFITRG